MLVSLHRAQVGKTIAQQARFIVPLQYKTKNPRGLGDRIGLSAKATQKHFLIAAIVGRIYDT